MPLDNRKTAPFVRCPRSTCQAFLEVPAGTEASKIRCPACKAPFIVDTAAKERARSKIWA